MKRLYVFILSIMLFSASFAQDHLKFMGIPLDGTINQFQAKLVAKGMTVDYAANKFIGIGCRKFKGSFSGEESLIYVFYDEKTKIVYRAKAVIDTSWESIRDEKYKYFVNMLSTKYFNAESNIEAYEGHESTSFYVPNDDDSLYKYLGKIIVYCVCYDSSSFGLHIDYFDTINLIKHENRNLDDL